MLLLTPSAIIIPHSASRALIVHAQLSHTALQAQSTSLNAVGPPKTVISTRIMQHTSVLNTKRNSLEAFCSKESMNVNNALLAKLLGNGAL